MGIKQCRGAACRIADHFDHLDGFAAKGPGARLMGTEQGTEAAQHLGLKASGLTERHRFTVEDPRVAFGSPEEAQDIVATPCTVYAELARGARQLHQVRVL
jgi:hypothetical protein